MAGAHGGDCAAVGVADVGEGQVSYYKPAGRLGGYRSATNVPWPVEPVTRPSLFKILMALTTVAVAIWCSVASAMIVGSREPGGLAPLSISARSSAASCWLSGRGASRCNDMHQG
jgi:hypothetical protein